MVTWILGHRDRHVLLGHRRSTMFTGVDGSRGGGKTVHYPMVTSMKSPHGRVTLTHSVAEL